MATIRDFARMCKSNKEKVLFRGLLMGEYCKSTCPFFAIKKDEDCVCYIASCTEKAEAIIDKWVSEHPVKTYRDDFLSKFPKPKFEPNRYCRASLYVEPRTCYFDDYGEIDCDKYWLQEYKWDRIMETLKDFAWRKEHPEVKVKTYADDFFEKFPEAKKTKDGMPYGICANALYCTKSSCGFDCRNCWTEEYEDKKG